MHQCTSNNCQTRDTVTTTVCQILSIDGSCLWSPLSCWRQSRPFPSTSGLHSGFWKTQANLAENGWGQSAPTQFEYVHEMAAWLG